MDDPRFAKNGTTVLDNLLTFYTAGSGFRHSVDGSGDNLMASEQGFYALVAVQRIQQGKSSLYRMTDAPSSGSAAPAVPAPEPAAEPAAVPSETGGQGLPGKDPAVHSVAKSSTKTFNDVSGHKNQTAIADMAARGIISGKGSKKFDPDAGMTRAEFAKIVVSALGMTPAANGKFSDVASSAWYAPSVGTASQYKIITGVGGGKFNPNGAITRQEAAAMVARAAKLCGLDTEMGASGVRNMLAQFSDYTKSAEWARPSLAFCYQSGILDQADMDIRPLAAVTRAEVAQMLYNMLGSAKLL